MSSYNFSNFVSPLTSRTKPTNNYDLMAILSGSSKTGILFLGNLLIQWGSTTNFSSNSGYNINLNVGYSNASDYIVVGVPQSGQAQDGSGITMINSNNTTTTFHMRVWGGGQVGVNWLAIGSAPTSPYPDPLV